MDPKDIEAAAFEILDHPASESEKLEMFKSKHPEMAERYPKLFAMCCRITPESTPKEVTFAQQCLKFMMRQLSSVDLNSEAQVHAASGKVGTMLFDHYIKPRLS